MLSPTFAIEDTKSPQDSKEYRLLTLENELEVLLIKLKPKCDKDYLGGYDEDFDDEDVDDDSEDGGEVKSGSEESSSEEFGTSQASEDPENMKITSKPPRRRAGACLTVGAGSFSEPASLGGLAHYLEHMLFMGSEKYPSENAFEEFLSAHGGYSNGETDCERTSFMFEVGPDHLEKSLDMFAQFFVSPLMKADAMDRELCAIESEFSQATQSDQIRFQQVLCATTDSNHPFHRFNWGNKKSLKDIPQASNINLRDCILNFYSSCYSSNIMKLVVCGQDTLDEMELWTRKSFGSIENKKLKPKSFAKMTPPFGEGMDSSPAICKIVPLKDMDVIYLHWFLPPLTGLHHLKPHDYVASILGHESEGSILYLLKQLTWATSISAGLTESHGYDYGTFGCVFTIEIKLTSEGFIHYFEVVSIVFQFLKMMRSSTLPNWIFDEAKAISMLNFQFQEERDAIEMCEEVAALMQGMFQVPAQDLLGYDCLRGTFNSSVVETSVLQHLTVQNVRIHVASKSFGDSVVFEKEKWFDVEYKYESIDKSVLAQWSNVELNSKLFYQSRNPFIPSDLSLVDISSLETVSNPLLVYQNDRTSTWYHPDIVFRTPRAHVTCSITIPSIIGSALSIVGSHMYIRLVKDALNAYSYHAQVAQLSFDLHVREGCVDMFAGGFNDKLPELIHVIIDTLTSMDIQENSFCVIKEDLARHYKNSLLKLQSKAKYLRLQLIQNTAFCVEDLLRELQNLTLDNLRQFVKNELWKLGAHVVGLVHGNMTESTAIQLMNQISAKISGMAQTSAPAKSIPRLVRCIDNADKPIIFENSEQDQEVNTLVEFYFQMANHTIQTLAIADLIQQIMEEPLFDTLRTKKQLGYEVSCTVRVTHGILGYSITVISSSVSAHNIVPAIHDFLAEFTELLINMPTERFHEHVSSQVQIKCEPDVNMMAATFRYWDEISSERFAFNLNPTLAKWLQSDECTKECIINYIDAWFGPTGRKLEVRIIGQNAATKASEIPPNKFITSRTLLDYKNTLLLHNESKTIV
ncbi:Aste57867_20478 [Aphanomyces stellatus]|uniref:Aste57867_20478 protein n=1 Tax=Aphanomyces stellatus TaxID=120398 RepID=A0A485LH29_9STRA|nr:hypothetical protein As57867_020412 [Aphanomyces stellatus]VFT97164.1 Aste57867_20478 [Aphanomyces stellatus]